MIRRPPTEETWRQYRAYVDQVRARNVGKKPPEQAVAWPEFLRCEDTEEGRKAMGLSW